MKNKLFLFFLFSYSFCFAQQCPIIPLPNNVTFHEGVFKVTNSTPLIIEQPELGEHANYLQREILKHLGITLSIQSGTNLPSIKLRKIAGSTDASAEYNLQISPSNVIISSKSNEGLFYGIISFMQLMRQANTKNNMVAIGCWDIKDFPHYSWRGLMLDESRHFFGKEVVKTILDWMAFYKLNKFHWHLTDAPGWRFEVKSYPLLTLIGGIGNNYDPNLPATYYSQENIKEIISYAKERYISIIPEIDMPGHASAANRAYPEFSGGGSEDYPEFTFNPGKDSTYVYLSQILKETDVLFPSQMIHLGGDEVSFGNEKWNSDVSVKQLMQRNNLKDLIAVEHYFTRRMADSLFKINNKVLLWDEATESDLPIDKTIIFWWRYNKTEQLKKALDKGFPTVLVHVSLFI